MKAHAGDEESNRVTFGRKGVESVEIGDGAPPDVHSVRRAAARLQGIANRTPVVTSRHLDEICGASIHLKCESFQRTGSFKFRGAYNAVSALPEAERAAGVLTYSSGNHAQAVALAGRLLGARVTVVMPTDAPLAKRSATEGYGARVVPYDPATSIREEVAAQIASETGMAVIPPFDHADVLSGQGTAALEAIEQAGPYDVILAPCGGGGLLSGTALAASSLAGCSVVGVEPELADDATRTFHTGTIHRTRNPPTIADGLRTPSLGRITWGVIREHVSDMRTVSEEAIVNAMRFLWTRMKLVVEPSGAVALAAVLEDPALVEGRRACLILSGGNVDLDSACRLLTMADGARVE